MLVANIEDVSAIPPDVTELKGVELTDALLLSIIRRARFLKRLDLLGCENLTDASAAQLAGIASLEEIDLGGCSLITDATPQALSTLPRLRALSLGFCYRVTDAALEALGKTTTIDKLLLWSCEAITDKGVKAIAELSGLSWLELPEFACITDEGLGVLARAGSNLVVLRITQLDQVSDRGVMALRRLSKLRRLQIESCKQISEFVVGELQRALPECRIMFSR